MSGTAAARKADRNQQKFVEVRESGSGRSSRITFWPAFSLNTPSRNQACVSGNQVPVTLPAASALTNSPLMINLDWPCLRQRRSETQSDTARPPQTVMSYSARLS